MRIIHFERSDETFSLGVAVGEGLSLSLRGRKRDRPDRAIAGEGRR